jgi:anaerobic selenocysteine-containing dehydrogenase
VTVLESGNYELILLGLAVRNVAKYSPPAIPRPPEALDDWDILSELAIRLTFRREGPMRRALRRVARGLPERIIDLLLRVGQYGSLAPGRPGLTLAALAAAPHGVDLGPLVPARRRRVHTPGHRVRLAPPRLVAEIPRIEKWIDEGAGAAEGLVLIGRRHLRGNNSWMHNLPILARGHSRASLLMHPGDAATLGLADGELVRVSSRTGQVTARLQLTGDIRPGVVCLPLGYGHEATKYTLRVAGALEGPNVNALTDESRVEPILGTSILTGIPVRVERAPREEPREASDRTQQDDAARS